MHRVWGFFEVLMIVSIVFVGAYIFVPIAAYLWAQLNEEDDPEVKLKEKEEPEEWDKLEEDEREYLRRFYRY